jgi:uncharacterized membrane protein
MSDTFLHTREEYLALRKEIDAALADLAALEKNCVVAIALIYSWLASQMNMVGFEAQIGWLVPLFVAIFGALRSYSIGHHLGVMGSYIKGIEEIYKPGGEKAIGWEHFFENNGKHTQGRVRNLFWIALCLSTAVVWVRKLWG